MNLPTIIIAGIAGAIVVIALFSIFAKGTSVTQLKSPHARYNYATVAAVVRDKPVLMTVRGGPFEEPTMAARVADTASEKLPAIRARFTTDAEAVPRTDYRVVMVFDRTRGRPNGLCGAGGMSGDVTPDSTLWLNAAFCHENTELTATAGQLKSVSGIDDPRIADLIGDTLRMLFPRNDGSGGP